MCASSAAAKPQEKVLVIDRGDWLTGTAQKLLGGSRLREKRTGLQCCLGFECRREGFSVLDIDGLTMPVSLPSNSDGTVQYESWMDATVSPAEKKLFRAAAEWSSPTVQNLLADTNDNEKLHPIRKEARIAKLFKKYGGITVRFVGHYAVATAKARKANEQEAQGE